MASAATAQQPRAGAPGPDYSRGSARRSAQGSSIYDLPFWKTLVLVNGAVPLCLLAWDAGHHQLGANAVNSAIHTTGMLALIFLTLALLVTPLRRLTGWNVLVGFRRALGLYGFFYACTHLLIYFVYDRQMSVSNTVHEILTRLYLQVGFIAIMLMTPLAITSTNGMLRRLGARRWKRLHRLAYVVTALGVLHYYMEVKSDVRLPLAFAGTVGALLLARFIWNYADLVKAAHRATASGVSGAAGVMGAGGTSIGATAPHRKFWSGELQVARVFDETPEVRTFRLVSPDGGRLPFEHLPGQYMNLQLSIDGKKVPRSYTIASSPTRDEYCELTIKREDRGVASSHLHRNVHAGDRIKISAPAGKFVFSGKEAPSVLLIAGGVGITPMMSIARALTDRSWDGEIYFLVVAKTDRDIIFRDELMQLQKRHSNLHLHITLTRETPGKSWSGRCGRPTVDWLSEAVPEIASKPAYICGPDEMMSATRELLLKLGVPDAQIKTEAFVSPGVALKGAQAGSVDSAGSEAADGPDWSDESDSSDGLGRLNSSDGVSVSEAQPIATFAHSGKSIALTPELSILEASENLGLHLPFDCRSGICGQCKMKLVSGAVTMEVEDALSPTEKAAGWILACQAHALNDVTVDA